MPWRTMDSMDLKMRFVDDEFTDVFPTFIELCDYYGISRKTGYKWKKRFREHGINGLINVSRKPKFSPTATDQRIIDLIIKERIKHKFWGPKKLYKPLRKHVRVIDLPAPSTISNILKRNGLIAEKRYSRKRGHPGQPLNTFKAANDLWSIDFKGQFKTKNGVYCYPLTVSDNYSRYLLTCKGFLSPNYECTYKQMERTFKEYGLPLRIRSDNGTPFASTAIGRLSRLSIWWIKLGIYPELIEPGSPQQNGIHERMHKTLKQETTFPPSFSLQGQQVKFNNFIYEFNNERTHEALNDRTPSELYTHSFREMPSKLPPIEYPAHYETRLVSDNGGIRWNMNWVNVGQVLKKEYIGLEELDYGIWDVYFGPVKLGRLLEKQNRIIDIYIQKKNRLCNLCP
jgi:putative transposase